MSPEMRYWYIVRVISSDKDTKKFRFPALNVYICTVMMKKTLLSLVAIAAALTLSAQEIRTNYRSEGMTHISTEAESCQDFTVRVERVGFPDGSSMYQLFIDLRQKTGFTAPKGVKMTATLPGGSVVRADQIGQESATKTRQEDGLYLNRLRYAMEEADMDKLTRGVSDLELVTGWEPDSYLRYHFKDNAFAALLKRHCAAIEKAAETTIDLTAEAAGRVDLTGSVMTAATPLVADGQDLKYEGGHRPGLPAGHREAVPHRTGRPGHLRPRGRRRDHPPPDPRRGQFHLRLPFPLPAPRPRVRQRQVPPDPNGGWHPDGCHPRRFVLESAQPAVSAADVALR